MIEQKNWARVDELFDQALDKPESERSRFLDEACRGDDSLRTEVERLLELCREDVPTHHVSLTGTLHGPLWEDVLRDLGTSEEERLVAGDRLQGYEILGFLGKGGMGSVYRARDALGREVAIKALSKIFVPDPPSQRRFQREAKVLASLRHPGIGAIYDLVIDDGYPYLILELVEGETLSERLARGALPLDEVLAIATQLVDAVEAAHEKRIVHRDLKPGNVKLAPGGRVKVLDFGLAKSHARDEVSSTGGRVEDAETTQTGMVLGTPAYMSPEQARGDAVDERADIWAFGCLVYEMLTGARAFGGASTSDVIASVLRDEVDFDRLRPSTPAPLERLVRRCLEKDPTRRLQHIREARVELSELVSGAWKPRGTRGTRGGRLGLAVAGLALALLAGVVASSWWREVGPRRLANPVQITSSTDRDDFPAWSPDGSTIAYASLSGSNWDLWTVPAAGGDPVNATADHDGVDFAPSWSPDGREIAFRSSREGGGIFLLSPLSGAPRKVVSDPLAADVFSTPAWSPDGSRLIYTVRRPEAGPRDVLEILSLATGEVERFDLERDWYCLCDVAISPGGRFLAYVDAQDPMSQISQLWLYRFEDGKSIRLTDDRTREASPTWAGSERSLSFVSNLGGSMDLWRIDLEDDGSPSGEPERLTVGVGMERARFSRDGSKLAYSQGRRVANLYRAPLLRGRRAKWTDVEQLTFDQAFVEFVDVSPDGTEVVVSSDRAGNPDLWSFPASGGALKQLTSDPTPDWLPAYSPDGTRIAFYAYRSGNRDLWLMPAEGGEARQITMDESSDLSPGWTHDGEKLLFYSDRGGGVDLWSVPAEGGDATRLLESPAVERFARASSDGKWIAYTSFGDGEPALWRVPAAGGERELVIAGAALYIEWAHDGESLYFTPYRGLTEDVWRVPAEGGAPVPVTDLAGRRGRVGSFALAADDGWVYFTWEEDLGDLWTMDAER